MKKTLLVTLFALLAIFAPLSAHLALASPASDACEVLKTTNPSVNCDNEEGSTEELNSVFVQVIEILSIVVGAVSVVVIIIGGFKYIVSAGDSNGIQSAKNTILYALVGLVVAVFAQVIARFVLGQVT